MNARLESPALCCAHVRVFVVALVMNAIRIVVEANHQHVDGAGRTVRSGRDDVVHVKMLDALHLSLIHI